jgi:precorrin-4 methylase
MVLCCYISTGSTEVNSAEMLEPHHKNQRPVKIPVAINQENENVIIQPISQIREMIDNTEAMKKGLYVLVTLSLSVLLYICYRSVK